MVTRVKTFGPTASVAATKTQVGSDYNVPKIMNTIKGIIVTCSSITSAEKLAGYVILELDNVTGPFEIPVGGGGFLTSGGAGFQPFICPLNISGVAGSVLKVYITGEAAVEWHVGVMFE